MFVRICAAAMFVSLIVGAPAQARVQEVPQFKPQTIHFRSLFKVPDPRGEFVRLCAPHMVGRWAHPRSVCGCLHDYAAATVDDPDLREALLRGISETGVPTIENDWIPASKQAEIGPTFTKIAQADAAMHVRASDRTGAKPLKRRLPIAFFVPNR